jgi:Carboxypeptidase regulatory-like domain
MRLVRRCVLFLWPLVLVGCAVPGAPQAQQYASVSGTVVDAATNAPIPGATVTIDVVNTAQTATNGSFTIGNLPGGPADCSVSAPNYVTRTNDWCTMPLPAGQTTNVGQIKLTHS